MHEQVSKHHFNLGAGEEPSWACPDAVAKVDIVDAGRGMLIFEFVAWDLSKSREPKCIESRRIRVQFWILVDGVAQHGRPYALRENMTGG